MSNLESPPHSKLDPRLQRYKDFPLPLYLLLLPFILPVALFVLIFVDQGGTQGESDFFEPDREPDLSPETSEQDQDPRSAAPAEDLIRADQSRPSCTCSCHRGPTGTTSETAARSSPRSSTSSGSVDSVQAPGSADTSPLGGGSEGSSCDTTAPEEAVPTPAPANTMQHDTGAAASPTAHTGEDLGRPTTSLVSPQTRASSGATLLALTGEQQLPDVPSTISAEERDNEELRRRNVRMREEGVRVRVSYLQLTDPTSAWRGKKTETQGCDAGVAAAAAAIAGSNSSPSVSGGPPTPCTPSSSGSGSPGSDGRLLLPPAALPAPAHTPGSGYVAISPVATPPSPSQKQDKVLVSSVLPTSAADAGPALVKIGEKLLAVPADAVSRRLLIDGRAILKRKLRTPRTPRSPSSSNGGGCGRGVPSSVEVGEKSSGYPSELME